jgi:tetratricopeptide (TPR) repeat protein
MSLAQFYERVINWPGRFGIIAGLVVAGVLVVIAAVLLLAGKLRTFARVLGVIGLVLAIFAFGMVHEQTIAQQQSQHVTVVHYRYSQPFRILSRVTLLVLPVVALWIMTSAFRQTQRSLRAQVPGRIKSGRALSVQKEYAAALREYNEAIRTAPELAEGYLRRGALYQTMGEPALALADFDRALESDPRLAPAYLARAKIRTERGDLDDALADFGELMAIRVNDPESYLHRGICLVKKGRFNEAAADFHRVLKLTNHSDFAEPAKSFLKHCENAAQSPIPPFNSNGSPLVSESPQPKAHDLS